jgi:hypothetical protein
MDDIDSSYKKYLDHVIKSGEKDKDEIKRRTAHIALNQFIKKNLDNSLKDDTMVRELKMKEIKEILKDKHILQQFIIGHIIKHHSYVLGDEKIVKNLMNQETKYMCMNYLDTLIKEYPELMFNEYFDAMYLYNNDEVDKYMRERYGRDIDIKTIYSNISRMNKKNKK